MALTYNQGRDLVKAAVNLLQKLELFVASASPNYDGLFDTVLAANLGDLQDLVAADVYAHRAGLSQGLSPITVQRVLRGPMAEWAIACGAPEGTEISLPKALERVRDYQVLNSLSINAREFTRGAVTAGGSNTGNGAGYRVTVDEDGFALEGSHAEVKTLTCQRDQAQVDKHREEFSVEGAKAERDSLVVSGSGIVEGISSGGLRTLSTVETSAFVGNPTFSSYSGTAPSAGVESTPSTTTSIPNWVLDSASLARVSLDVAYLDLVGETQKYSVRFTGNNGLTQTFNDVRRPNFPKRTPMLLGWAVYREGSVTGTLTLTWGAQTQAFTVGSLSNGAWNLCFADRDKDLYHKNWTTNGATLRAALSSYGGSGSIYLDRVIFAPMSLVDGAYLSLVGGATPFKRGDLFTITDTVNATRGILSYWIHHRSGLGQPAPAFCLPVNAAGAETVTDPS